MAKEEMMEEEYGKDMGADMDMDMDMEMDMDVEEEPSGEMEEKEMVDFASPTEALAAALKEHGADPATLMDWFDEYGYELVKKEGGGEEMEMDEEMGEGPMDLVGLRTSVVEKLGPMLGGKK